MSNFADYFAGVANHYADSRPSYPAATLETQLRAAWGDAQNTRRIEWPLTLLAGRV